MKKILVVEDDSSIRETFAEILQGEGYEVISAKNGLEALEFLEHGVDPNLILLDLMMPVMDGFTFREEQMKHPHWAGIPVVVMSADGNIKQKQERIGSSAYLKKPADLEEFISIVSKYSDFHPTPH